jgi:hypothetical protein
MRDGKARAYSGGRSLNDLLSFSKQMTAAPVVVHSSPPPLSHMLAAQPSVFLLVSPSSSPSPAAAAFERNAYSLQGMAAFHHLQSATPAFLASLSLPASLDQPVLLHFSRGMQESEGEQYSGDWDDAELSRWIGDRLLPLVSTMDQSNVSTGTVLHSVPHGIRLSHHTASAVPPLVRPTHRQRALAGTGGDEGR